MTAFKFSYWLPHNQLFTNTLPYFNQIFFLVPCVCEYHSSVEYYVELIRCIPSIVKELSCFQQRDICLKHDLFNDSPVQLLEEWMFILKFLNVESAFADLKSIVSLFNLDGRRMLRLVDEYVRYHSPHWSVCIKESRTKRICVQTFRTQLLLILKSLSILALLLNLR